MQTFRVSANGVSLNVLAAGSGPLVLLVHGFPGSSFSWRHQVPLLAAAGYRAVAVDTRGYGASERPETGYTAETIEHDLLGVLDHFEAERAVLIGQDFGSRYCWNLARHHPERVRGVVGTVPFGDLSAEQRPSEVWQALAGQHFLHLDYFQEPGRAERDLGGENAAEFLSRLLWALSAEGNYFAVFGHDSSVSYLQALPEAPGLPWGWLSQAEFETMLAGFRSGGEGREFAGGFGSYRAADDDWAYEEKWRGVPIEVPAMLLIGEHDPVRKFTRTDPSLFADLREVVVPGAGHHVQQEQPEAVNRALLDFLGGLD